MSATNQYKEIKVWGLSPTHFDLLFINPPTLTAFPRSPLLMDLHPSQQHAGLHHAVWKPQQEVTRAKARFKHTLHEKSGVQSSANVCF